MHAGAEPNVGMVGQHWVASTPRQIHIIRNLSLLMFVCMEQDLTEG